jgi:hypothetical protein
VTRGKAKEEACGHEETREEEKGKRASEETNTCEEAVREAEGRRKAWRHCGAKPSRGPSRFGNAPATESLPHHDPKSEHRG